MSVTLTLQHQTKYQKSVVQIANKRIYFQIPEMRLILEDDILNMFQESKKYFFLILVSL